MVRRISAGILSLYSYLYFKHLNLSDTAGCLEIKVKNVLMLKQILLLFCFTIAARPVEPTNLVRLHLELIKHNPTVFAAPNKLVLLAAPHHPHLTFRNEIK